MQIALCDNDKKILSTLDTCIHAYFSATAFHLKTDRFLCAETFLSSALDYEIVFMGVHLNGMSGVEAARILKPAWTGHIVFIDSGRESAIDAFDLDAAHYLLKPLTAKDIFEALDRCLARPGKPSRAILKVKSGSIMIPVPIDDITYIEVFNKVCVIHTTSRSIQTYTSLDALSRQLSQRLFIRAQRSYLVHMEFIDAFLYDSVLLKNGLTIGLARKKRAELKKQYQDYLQTSAMASRSF